MKSFLPPTRNRDSSKSPVCQNMAGILCISPVITLRVYCNDVFICQSPLLGCALITGRNHVLHLSESTSLSTRSSTGQMLTKWLLNECIVNSSARHSTIYWSSGPCPLGTNEPLAFSDKFPFADETSPIPCTHIFSHLCLHLLKLALSVVIPSVYQ